MIPHRAAADPVKAAAGAAVLGVLSGMVLILSGCATASSPRGHGATPQPPRFPRSAPPERLRVFDAGWHTGLILSRAQLGPPLVALRRGAPASRYFLLGWGNRRYYLSRRPTVVTAIVALFPSQSVMLIQSCRATLAACLSPGVRWRTVAVSRQGIHRLDDFLAHALLKDARGDFEPISAGPFPHSEFFKAVQPYDALHTCNTWTAQALHRAGLWVSVDGVVFAGQVWRQLKPN